jgi:hypothetical protein
MCVRDTGSVELVCGSRLVRVADLHMPQVYVCRLTLRSRRVSQHRREVNPAVAAEAAAAAAAAAAIQMYSAYSSSSRYVAVVVRDDIHRPATEKHEDRTHT